MTERKHAKETEYSENFDFAPAALGWMTNQVWQDPTGGICAVAVQVCRQNALRQTPRC